VLNIGQDHDGQRSTVKRVRLWDKPKNLELLGKHLRMFLKRQEHTVKDRGPVQWTILPVQAAGKVEGGQRDQAAATKPLTQSHLLGATTVPAERR
jgi:hypothetical protein